MTEWKIMTNKTPKLLDRNNNKDERIFAFAWYQFAVFVHKIFCIFFRLIFPDLLFLDHIGMAGCRQHSILNSILYDIICIDRKRREHLVAGFFYSLNFLFSLRWKIIKLREIYFTSKVNKNRILSSFHSVCLTLVLVSAYMMMAKRWKWKA